MSVKQHDAATVVNEGIFHLHNAATKVKQWHFHKKAQLKWIERKVIFQQVNFHWCIVMLLVIVPLLWCLNFTKTSKLEPKRHASEIKNSACAYMHVHIMKFQQQTWMMHVKNIKSQQSRCQTMKTAWSNYLLWCWGNTTEAVESDCQLTCLAVDSLWCMRMHTTCFLHTLHLVLW